MPGVGYELTPKFVKAHFINTAVASSNTMRYLHKLIYEFWGFCVNGVDDLRVAGGMPTLSGVMFPTGFQSGSSVLLASGTDGVTVAGMPFFTAPSVNWTSSSLLNKWLVTWKSGSSSTDDSIYPITQIINSSTIRLDMNAGGTAYTGSLHPSFTDRSAINYRVVDFNAVTALTGYTADADGLVLNFNAAYLVNTGQVAPQCRTRIRTSVGSFTPGVGLTLSASGSWTAASGAGSFTDGAAENQSSGQWFLGGGGTTTGYITLIGAQDFLLCHYMGNQTAGSGFHIEVPQRLYPQVNDPNPFVSMNFGSEGLTTTSTTVNYGGGMKAFNPPDGTTRAFRTLVRSLTGDYFNGQVYTTSIPNNVSNGRFNEMFFNIYRNKFIMFDMMCGLPSIALQFAALRFKLRRVRYVPPIIPTFQRFGDHGEWIHVSNGILWPWDNSVLPYNLFPAGA